jgi:hypothetical protein
MKITRSEDTRLKPEAYINKILDEVDMARCHGPATPIASSAGFPTEQAEPFELVTYQQMVGSLTYAANQTRPDIAFAASKMVWFNACPAAEHHRAVRRTYKFCDNRRA